VLHKLAKFFGFTYHPAQPDWTPPDLLGALALSVGRPLPQSTS
jgi:hypothetical protein